jgi:hypothetical protein
MDCKSLFTTDILRGECGLYFFFKTGVEMPLERDRRDSEVFLFLALFSPMSYLIGFFNM